jgi:biotin carboxyl carrier protein
MPVPAFDTDESQEHQRSSHGQHEKRPAQGPGAIMAPMAGRGVKIFVSNGARVKKGDSILVLEAMKMEVKSSRYHFFCLKGSSVITRHL